MKHWNRLDGYVNYASRAVPQFASHRVVRNGALATVMHRRGIITRHRPGGWAAIHLPTGNTSFARDWTGAVREALRVAGYHYRFSESFSPEKAQRNQTLSHLVTG